YSYFLLTKISRHFIYLLFRFQEKTEMVNPIVAGRRIISGFCFNQYKGVLVTYLLHRHTVTHLADLFKTQYIPIKFFSSLNIIYANSHMIYSGGNKVSHKSFLVNSCVCNTKILQYLYI